MVLEALFICMASRNETARLGAVSSFATSVVGLCQAFYHFPSCYTDSVKVCRVLKYLGPRLDLFSGQQQSSFFFCLS